MSTNNNTAELPRVVVDGFAPRLLAWYALHGRHGLPWKSQDAYAVWVSEVMLQQTQVDTVLRYYPRFMACFPTVSALAEAPLEQVLTLWSGLGYYGRARRLWQAAQQVMAEHQGRVPDQVELLMRLPGIGRSTAGAIASLAYQRRSAIVDGNVRRVLVRLKNQPDLSEPQLWACAEQLLPAQHMSDYTQALMDLGATVCLPREPQCGRCPVATLCASSALPQPVVPLKKPPRVQPQQLRLVAYAHHERWAVEQRGHSGIWGGLIAPCECTEQQWQSLLLRPRWQLESFGHVLTHRRLSIDFLGVWGEPLAEHKGRLRWLSAQELAAQAWPAPFAKRWRSWCQWAES